MFGLIKEQNRWDFAAFGKHPLTGDYLSLGSTTPLLTGFSLWMEQGYSRLPREKRARTDLFWRFWAKGPNSKLVLGILKSSTDKLGREYPLLIIGEGKALDMAANWDLIPFACEKTWRFLEKVSVKKWATIEKFNQGLMKIRGPKDTWTAFLEKKQRIQSIELSPHRNENYSDFMNKMNNVDGLTRLDRFSIRIDVGQPNDYIIPVVKLLTLLKHRSKTEPGTVFIGGGGDVKQMRYLKQSPVTDDFIFLWHTVLDKED